MKMFERRIYLDFASLTPIDRRVLRTMRKYSSPRYANASSWYKEGIAAKKTLDEARKKVAVYLHSGSDESASHSDEIYFTGGGTESNNIAILGAIEKLREQGIEYGAMRILVSEIEHSSVRECANHLSDLGVIIDTVPVDRHGLVSPEQVKKMVKPNTAIVSIMTVNNEVGNVQPIREIAKAIRQARAINEKESIFNFQTDTKYPLFHTDAAQAIYQELNVEKMGVDMLTLDSSKVYGPRGVGALFVKRNTPISPIIHGGGQEMGLRSGTENLPGIMGFARALEISTAERSSETARLGGLKNYFIHSLKKIRPDIKINGGNNSATGHDSPMHISVAASPHIVSVTIPGIDNEFFVLQLDAKGIACSTKSSCLEDEDESYVLKAMGVKSKETVRFSFGRGTTKGQVSKVAKVIASVIHPSQSSDNTL